MWRTFISGLFMVAFLGFILTAALISWGRGVYRGPGPLVEAVCFRVEKGAAISSVSQQLKQIGAIQDTRIFRIGAEYTQKSNDLKFGSYLLAPKQSMESILEELTSLGVSTCGPELNLRIGPTASEIILKERDPRTQSYVELLKHNLLISENDGDKAALEQQNEQLYLSTLDNPAVRLSVTIIEGVTSFQVVEALNLAPFLTGVIDEIPAEGYLAPDSYGVERDEDRQELILKMEQIQQNILTALWATRSADLPYKTPQEALIMASIIEKETSAPQERPIVASVFINRLKRGIKLQTDPTVIYGITQGKGPLGRGIRRSELERETPYNTYIINGLPPTPIANPGRESIAAALSPAQTDYIFFVANGNGTHAFAKSLDEHRRNVREWRRIERERKE